MWEAEKTVEVTANIKGKDEQCLLGYVNKPIFELKEKEDGSGSEWVETGKSEILFGYCDMVGWLTHMSYTLSTHRHETWADWITGVRHDRFYFDAGSNGCPIYVTTDRVATALIELGLIDTSKENAFVLNPPCGCEFCTANRMIDEKS